MQRVVETAFLEFWRKEQDSNYALGGPAVTLGEANAAWLSLPDLEKRVYTYRPAPTQADFFRSYGS